MPARKMRIGFYLRAFKSPAIECLSAVLKRAGHETFLFFDPALGDDLQFQNKMLARLCGTEDLVIDRMASSNLDVAAFSITTDLYRDTLRVAGKFKKLADVPTVFGGVHVSALPERVVALWK